MKAMERRELAAVQIELCELHDAHADGQALPWRLVTRLRERFGNDVCSQQEGEPWTRAELGKVVEFVDATMRAL
jgi:hypothetical protein